MDIHKNNLLIAPFMGGKFYHRKELENRALWHFEHWQGGTSISNGYSFSDKILYYHKCWDWLMPVVEKIEMLEAEVSIVGNMCAIGYNDIYYTETFEINKLTATYAAVVDFITWFNEHKSNENI